MVRLALAQTFLEQKRCLLAARGSTWNLRLQVWQKRISVFLRT
jgi:hypothetical protein